MSHPTVRNCPTRWRRPSITKLVKFSAYRNI